MHKLMPLLAELPGQKLMLPKRKIDSMEAFIAAFPQAVEVIIDGMERPIQRPKKTRNRKHDSGKKKGTRARRSSWWNPAGASAAGIYRNRKPKADDRFNLLAAGLWNYFINGSSLF